MTEDAGAQDLEEIEQRLHATTFFVARLAAVMATRDGSAGEQIRNLLTRMKTSGVGTEVSDANQAKSQAQKAQIGPIDQMFEEEMAQYR